MFFLYYENSESEVASECELVAWLEEIVLSGDL